MTLLAGVILAAFVLFFHRQIATILGWIIIFAIVMILIYGY